MTLGRLEKKPQGEESEITYYKQLLRKSPNRYSYLNFLADALFRQAEYVEAIHCWKKILRKRVTKDSYRVLMKVAQAYELIGEIEHAFHYYGKAIEINPDSLNAIGKYGQMAYVLENFEDALDAFKLLAEREPYNEIAWHNLGLTYYNLGYHDQALECLEHSSTLDDESAETWYTLATIFSEEYNFNEALIALEKALLIDPSLQENARKEQSFYSLKDLSLFRFMIKA
ncbi:MAG: tetratricopeptide repeat protein [Candidatus Heimdallarchaeota archaeon]